MAEASRPTNGSDRQELGELLTLVREMHGHYLRLESRMRDVEEITSRMPQHPETDNAPQAVSTPRSVSVDEESFVTVDRVDATPNVAHQRPTSLQPPRASHVDDNVPSVTGFTLKSKDILVLKLPELHGVESDAKLTRFFDQVESCATADQDRINLAKVKVDENILTLLTVEMSKIGRRISWVEFKNILNKNFSNPMTVNQAWDEIENEYYTGDEPPRCFVNRLRCKVSALEMKFPHDQLPRVDSVIKRKLYYGVNKKAQRKLRHFLDDNVTLSKFLEIVTEEHQIDLRNAETDRRNVFPVNKSSFSRSQPTNADHTSCTDPKILKMEKQLNELCNKFKTFGNKKANNADKYCAFCRVREHSLTECPNNPPIGVCFDCLRPNCKRGAASCPGRVQNQQQ